MSGDRLALATRTRKARRNSTCPSCRGLITVGEYIAKVTDPNGWIHLGCVPVVREALARIAAGRMRA